MKRCSEHTRKRTDGVTRTRTVWKLMMHLFLSVNFPILLHALQIARMCCTAGVVARVLELYKISMLGHSGRVCHLLISLCNNKINTITYTRCLSQFLRSIISLNIIMLLCWFHWNRVKSLGSELLPKCRSSVQTHVSPCPVDNKIKCQ